MLTNNELQLMKILWAEDRELSRTDMLHLISSTTIKPNSLYALLNELLEKGAIKVVGMCKAKKTYARTYRPAIQEEDYQAWSLEKAVDKYKDAVSARQLVGVFSNVVKDADFDLDSIQALKQLVDEKIKELEE